MWKEEKAQRTEVPVSDSGEKPQILFSILAKTCREIRPAFCITAELFQLAQGARAFAMDPKVLK